MRYSEEHILPKSATEYFAQNCWVGVSQPGEDAAARHQIGLDRFMWGSDYPHQEGTYPYTREHLRQLFHDTDPAELQQLLAGNAAKLYGFDLDALAPIAAKVGPTLAEIAQPLDALPENPNEALLKGRRARPAGRESRGSASARRRPGGRFDLRTEAARAADRFVVGTEHRRRSVTARRVEMLVLPGRAREVPGVHERVAAEQPADHLLERHRREPSRHGRRRAFGIGERGTDVRGRSGQRANEVGIGSRRRRGARIESGDDMPVDGDNVRDDVADSPFRAR